MEILKKKETEKMKFRKAGQFFDTPIRRAVNSLKVGESVVFTSKEWHEYYKSMPHGAIASWVNNSEKKLSIRTHKKERTKKGSMYTWAVIRKN